LNVPARSVANKPASFGRDRSMRSWRNSHVGRGSPALPGQYDIGEENRCGVRTGIAEFVDRHAQTPAQIGHDGAADVFAIEILRLLPVFVAKHVGGVPGMGGGLTQ
jgi:hypothetical protein